MNRLLPLIFGFAAGCVAETGPSAADFVADDLPVTPGLASCLTRIERPDVIDNPGADLSTSEIEALVNCTAERASR